MWNHNSSLNNKEFFANACHVCQVYGKDKVKRCANCKLIAYCSQEHQKKHWPQHKELCRGLRFWGKIENIYRFFGFCENTDESWRDARMNSIYCIKNLLGRELTVSERRMLAFPRCCEICHETDSLKLQDCGECPSASFCLNHPKDNEHSVKCKASTLNFQANNIPFTPVTDYMKLPSMNYGKSIPKNMDEVTNFFESFCPADKTVLPKELWKAVLASHLSRVYTFLYSIEKILWPKSSKLTIHVIGANIAEATSLSQWQYLLHHDESLEEIEIVFVGPELLYIPVNVKLPKMKMKTIGIMYEHFVATSLFTIPDFVIGFNLKIDESFHFGIDTWSQSIKTLARIGCPFFLTSTRFAEGLKKDRERINSILGKKCKPFWAGENPFPGRVPCREFPYDDFSYDNRYLAVYKRLG
ncbi:uncharacterized protein [Venturia canescens]|uniref:uncharacterized protein n=1 Tax=Venturia canescens TaxID=32260 RepID=UPI001C9D2354|nr:uncharacterized protein LOC122408151 [Venturia canescens]